MCYVILFFASMVGCARRKQYVLGCRGRSSWFFLRIVGIKVGLRAVSPRGNQALPIAITAFRDAFTQSLSYIKYGLCME